MTLGELLKNNIETRRNKILKDIIKTVTSDIKTYGCVIKTSLNDYESQIFTSNCSQYKDLIQWCYKENLVLDHRGSQFIFVHRLNV